MNYKNNHQTDDDTFTVSFSPVAKETDVVESDTMPLDLAVQNKSSERLERLRAYYGQLGKVRDDMGKELEKILEGSMKEGEIEKKLYDFSHSRQVIAEELNQLDDLDGRREKLSEAEIHIGQNLTGSDFSGQSLVCQDFSAANLQDANFSQANLSGTDFTGADLSGADFSGADLSYSIFANAKLKGVNFTGANMEGVILRDADIEDAILMDINIDELAIEELQALVEYLAVYYPHKLNLQRINLSLLDLTRVDLRWVNLRGVDFTGINMTGVNIMELDLSECIITAEQIAQALGRIPSAEEFKQMRKPKNKKKAKPFYIDFSDLFSDGNFEGWIDLTKSSISTDELVGDFFKIRDILVKRPNDA
ncbi:MAG: pentapeptide repeat-containing protein, partial [Alphaproteobacteria bacterium]|nr:pentapeptide repeat-containing protein [Alphaproteobacteria bacterium]